MQRTSNNGPERKQALTPLINHSKKAFHHDHHHVYLSFDFCSVSAFYLIFI